MVEPTKASPPTLMQRTRWRTRTADGMTAIVVPGSARRDHHERGVRRTVSIASGAVDSSNGSMWTVRAPPASKKPELGWAPAVKDTAIAPPTESPLHGAV